MTETCERCQARLGEILQWELEHPATAAVAVAPLAMPRATPAPVAASALAPASPQAPSEAEQAEISAEEVRELWQHAAQCAECREALSLLRSAHQVLAELPQLAPPADLRSRIRASIAAPAVATETIAASVPTEPVVEISKAQAAMAKPVSSRPWWAFWKAASVSGAPPLTLRAGGAPRAVWAGGGALVAAFALVLALQIQPPPRQTVSESDSDTSAGAPGVPPSTIAKVPSPGNSTPSAKLQPPLAQRAGSAAGAKTTAPNQSSGASSSRTSEAAIGKARVPGRPQVTPSNPDSGALPDASLPEMPTIPAPPTLQRERPRAAKARPSAPRSQASLPESRLPRVMAGSAAAPKIKEPEASIRVQVEPLEAPAQEMSAASTYSTQQRAPESLQAPSPPVAAMRRSRVGASSPANSTPGARSDDQQEGNSAVMQSRSAGPSGPAGPAGPTNPEPSPRATGEAWMLRQPPRLRSGQMQNAPSRANATPTAPERPEADLASPSVAPPSGGFGGGSGAGGFGAGARGGGGFGGNDSGAGGFGGGQPQARSITPMPESGDAAPSSALSADKLGQSQATQAIEKGSTKSSSEAARRITAEIKAARDIKRAQVEVLLSEGWRFATGEGSKRVLWKGEARAGQVIRVEVALQAARADAPERAGTLILRDVSGSEPREVVRAEVAVPRPKPTR